MSPDSDTCLDSFVGIVRRERGFFNGHDFGSIKNTVRLPVDEVVISIRLPSGDMSDPYLESKLFYFAWLFVRSSGHIVVDRFLGSDPIIALNGCVVPVVSK